MFKKIQKNTFFSSFLKIFTLFLLILNNANAKNSFSGRWQTYDDHSSKPRSVILITQNNSEYRGKIKKINYKKGEGPNDRCDACTGKLHHKKILGMEVLWVSQDRDGQVSRCKILDPENGKTYHCQLALSDNGKKLKVRGYIGFPLIGRTQIWHRLS